MFQIFSLGTQLYTLSLWLRFCCYYYCFVTIMFGCPGCTNYLIHGVVQSPGFVPTYAFAYVFNMKTMHVACA